MGYYFIRKEEIILQVVQPFKPRGAITVITINSVPKTGQAFRYILNVKEMMTVDTPPSFRFAVVAATNSNPSSFYQCRNTNTNGFSASMPISKEAYVQTENCPNKNLICFNSHHIDEPSSSSNQRFCRFAFLPELFTLESDSDTINPNKSADSLDITPTFSRVLQNSSNSIVTPTTSLEDIRPSVPPVCLTRWGVLLSGCPGSALNQSTCYIEDFNDSVGETNNSECSGTNKTEIIFPLCEDPVGGQDPSSIFKTLRQEVSSTVHNYHVKETERIELERKQREAEMKQREAEMKQREAEMKQREAEEQERYAKELEKECIRKKEEDNRKQQEQIQLEKAIKLEEEKKNSFINHSVNNLVKDSLPDYGAISSSSNHLVDLQDPYIHSRLDMRDQWRHYIQHEYNEIKQTTHPEMKILRIKIKKIITLAINQLASTSCQVNQVAEKLTTILSTYQTTNYQLDQSRFYRYCIATILDSLLNNVEIQVASNPRAVWSFGALLPKLCEFQELNKCLESSILNRCSYIIPFFITKLKTMTQSEFELLRDQKKGETELDYFQRMSVFLRLWLVYLIVTKNHTLYWNWFARFLNSKPKRISPFLLSVALDVSGYIGLHFFPKQFRKLLMSYIPLIILPKYKQLHQKDQSGILSAAITQIQIYLEEYRTGGSLHIPEGFTMKIKQHEVDESF